MSRLLIAASLVSAATAIPAHGSSDQSDLEPDTATSHTLGLKWVSPDGRFAINPWLRAQLRYSDPFDDDPRTAPDFDDLPGCQPLHRRPQQQDQPGPESPAIHDTRVRLQWDISF
jgi:hypothetical protein